MEYQIIGIVKDNQDIGENFETLQEMKENEGLGVKFEKLKEDIINNEKIKGKTFDSKELVNIITDSLLGYHFELKINEKIHSLQLKKNIYRGKEKNNCIYIIDFKSNDMDDDEFYSIKLELKNILKAHARHIYIFKDSQNLKISSTIYEEIYKLENDFRNLINTFMMRKYGFGWFKKNILLKYDDKQKHYSSWYNKNYNDFNNVQMQLYNLQIDDLIKMLKDSYFSNELNREDIRELENFKAKVKEKSNYIITES